MQNRIVEELLYLYIDHPVRLCFRNGEQADGELLAADGETVVISMCGEERSVSLAELEDVRYRGTLSDYETAEGWGIIDNSYIFYWNDCVGSEDEEKINDFRYHEFDYKVTCHLELRKAEGEAQGLKQLGKIVACDLKLEDTPLHVINLPVLTKENFLYTFRNGSKKIGRLMVAGTAYVLCYGTKEVYSFEWQDVADITKCPAINDAVCVREKEETIKGIVCAVREEHFNVYTGQGMKKISYADLEELRYQGKIEGNREHISFEGKYATRVPYLRHWQPKKNVGSLGKGTLVSCVIGVNDHRGIIAKDLVIEQELDLSYVGVILTYNQDKNVGWIGNHYVTKAGGESRDKYKGHVSFKREDLPQNLKLEFGRYIYIVKYNRKAEPDSNGVYALTSMQLLETYDYATTGQVYVDEQNQVHWVPFFQKYIHLYKDRKVNVILKEAGKSISGRLVYVDEGTEQQGITVLCGEGLESEAKKVAFSEIEDIRIIGVVTTYYDNGTGYIDGKNYFNIKNVKNGVNYLTLEKKKVSFVLQNTNRGDGTDAVDVEILEDTQNVQKNKQLAGEEVVIVGYDAQKGYRVIDSKDYEAYAEETAVAYYVPPFGTVKLSEKSLEKYDYPATLTAVLREDQVHKEIIVSEQEKVNKRFFGYLTRVTAANGFITPDKNPYQTGIYCFLGKPKAGSPVLDEESLSYTLDTKTYCYRVAYTIDYNNQACRARGQADPAKTVRILRQELSMEEKKRRKYGFLAGYVQQQDCYKIFEEYHSNPDKGMNNKGVLVKKTDVDTYKNVSRYFYFVSYKMTPEGITDLTIIDRYIKKDILSAKAVDGECVIEYEKFKEPEGTKTQAEALVAGENIFVCSEKAQTYKSYRFLGWMDDQKMRVVDAFNEAQEEQLLDMDAAELTIYRLGVITAVDKDADREKKDNYIYINDYLKVSMDKMLGRTFNVFNNDPKKLLVTYTCGEDGTVEAVTLPELGMKELLPWKLGRVEKFQSVDRKERRLVVRCEEEDLLVDYYLSVDTDSYVSALESEMEGKSVYIRMAKRSAGGDSMEEWVALDIRCEFETLLVEEYQGENKAGYRVCRDNKRYFPVSMSEKHYKHWKANAGSKVEVRFKPYQDEEANTELLVACPRKEKHSNPYEVPAVGNPLEAGDSMFKGRTEEKRQVWNYIVRDGEFLKGNRVILYGQKRCGKSSLIRMIEHDLRNNEKIKQQAIIVSLEAVDVNPMTLESWLCREIVNGIINEGKEREDNQDMLKLIAERKLWMERRNDVQEDDFLEEEEIEEELKLLDNVYQNWLEQLKQKSKEWEKLKMKIDQLVNHMIQFQKTKITARNWEDIRYEYWNSFKELKNEFSELCPDYTIVLRVDEFTAVCMSVLNHPDTCSAENLSIINKLPELGIIQIIVGHDNMRKVLKKLELINSVTEKSLLKELTAFSYDDAKTLIKDPMEKELDIKTIYSEEAILKMMEISGNSPFVLMNLCNEMFKYYTGSDKEKTGITAEDVETVADEWCVRIANEQSDVFDAILHEPGDEKADDETTKELLTALVHGMKDGKNYCTKQDLTVILKEQNPDAWTEQRVDEKLATLKSRSVIHSAAQDEYSIVMGLFVRYTRMFDKK